MSDLTFNKVAGAVLATGLAIVGLREASAIVFAPHAPETPGYAIAIPEETGGGAPAVAPIDWGTVLPIADVAAGQASFAKCVSCHTIAQGGANGIGPNLWGVVGQRPAAHAGYAYSNAFVDYAATHPVWTHEELGAYLEAPQRHINGTKMTFVGLKRREELVNVVAYLHSMGGSIPFPAPAPVEEPATDEVVPAGEAVEGEAAPAAEGAEPAAEAPAAT
ncbi:MAG: cytochrome c family protein [Phenylobacterium sp.]|uniref:c-type cytochrome n=1 Tax=Phenylobacterium sp. TaxID=1871053 RepID=UPI00271CD64A|nr:cytochrome c family protein [Phenylobacterium sp.]MDO8902871.1 cytochrome c family protein [Phenylobacterium sp.]MDP2215377.1 cytochrome c family protein [Phenylobacterium sp.]